MTDMPGIGTVLVVRNSGAAAWLIRLGAAFRNRPNLGNHMAVMHHLDEATGIPWGIEGKPGGVGWVDLRNYLKSPWTVTNTTQPLGGDAAGIARTMELMLGTAYDWQAIAADAFWSLHIRDLFAQNWHGKGVPGHVVCSSLAAWAYGQHGIPHPGVGRERFVSPGDWGAFVIERGWQGA